MSKDGKSHKETIKLFYKYTDNAILIKFKVMKKTVQERDYDKFTESCQMLTGLKITPYEINKWGYAVFKLFDVPIPSFEIAVHKDMYEFAIGTGFEGLVMWPFNEFPHCLVVGETGQGKSTFLRYAISSLLKMGNVWVLDGKVVDYAQSSHIFYKYLSNKNTDNNLLFVRNFYNEMIDRYNLMEQNGVTEYIQLKLEPNFMLIDEYISVVGIMSKKEADQMAIFIGEIIRLGRASGMQLFFTMQRPDTTYISGATRDQFQLRIVLGNASKQAYQMMFESSDSKPLVRGKAWYKMGVTLDVMSIPNYKEIVYDEERITD